MHPVLWRLDANADFLVLTVRQSVQELSFAYVQQVSREVFACLDDDVAVGM
jgi:hypothetical protein